MRWALALAILAGAAGVALLVVRGTGPRTARSGATLDDGGDSRAPGGTSGSVPGQAGVAEAGEVVDGLDGVVVDREGDPVSGATVTLESAETKPKPVATTDAQGRFVLPVLRTPSMSLDARHPAYRRTHHFVNSHDPEPVRIVIETGAPLRVLVRGPNGPVLGATVTPIGYALSRKDAGYYYRVDLDDALTDKEGVADLGRVPVGWVQLNVDKEGFAPAWANLDIPDGKARTKEITLGPGGMIEGTVTGPDGRPVKDARLHDRGREKVLATTDEFGRYRITSVARWGILPIAEAEGHGPGSFGGAIGWGKPVRVAVEAGEVVRGVDIVLGPTSLVRGRVLDEQDRPVPDVEVSIEVTNGLVHTKTGKTGEDGRFELGPVTAREGTLFSLNVKKPNYTFLGDLYSEPLTPGHDTDVGIVRAHARATIAGRVYDLDGTPLQEGYVTVGASEQAPVEQDGTFVVENVRTFEHEIVAYGLGPARRRSHAKRVKPGEGERVEVELRLVETLPIAGRVVTDTGQPRPGVWLRAVPRDAKPPYFMGAYDGTDDKGRFELPGLLPGDYLVGLYEDAPRGWRFVEEPGPVVVAAGTRGVEIRVPSRGAILTGKVVAKGTRLPVREFGVSLYEIFLILPKHRDYEGFEDATGAFRIETDGPGVFFLDVWADGHAEHRTKPVKIKRGETVDLGTIALGDPGSIHGTVRDHTGRPVQWCRVYLLSSKLKANYDPPYTDARGRFDVKGLSPGTYMLFALSPRHPLSLRQKIEIGEGDRIRMDIEMVASAPLTIRVMTEQDQPIAGAQLVWTFPALKPLDSSMVGDREPPGFGSNVSDEAGIIRKPFFPEGEVELRIDAVGHARARRTVTMKAGEKKTVEIRLKRKG